jgi:hypothetical protein
MKIQIRPVLATLVLLSTLSLQPATVFAQGTAFTYQGRLNTNGVAYTGAAEFQFTLWDAVSGGSAVATNNPASLVATVTDGLFTVTLDFGLNPFNGQPRFLDTEVRTVIGPFTTLTPRQPVTATPYALRALNLTTNGLAGTYGNAVTFNNAGNSFAGAFNGALSGNGSGLTNLNATTLGGLSSATFWKTNGNAGANPTNGAFLGTTDNLPLEFKVSGHRALRLEPDFSGFYPNLIAGSDDNSIAAGLISSVIAGGEENNILLSAGRPSEGASVIAGGAGNSIGATLSGGIFIFGGFNFIGGGHGNNIRAKADFCTIGGGENNTVATNSQYATIPGGVNNNATNYAFAAGRRAKANHQGAFVWADSQNADFTSTASNQFLIRASGGVGIGTASPQANLHVAGSTVLQGLTTPSSAAATNLLNIGSGAIADGFRNGISFFEAGNATAMSFGYDGTGGSSQNALRIYNTSGADLFTFQANGNLGVGTNNPQQKLHVIGNILATGTVTGSSDRNAKENFTPVDPREVLEKVLSLPITRWNYKADSGVPHLGPMAQDFYSTFAVGMDDKHISMVDADGVALAAIQGLNQKLNEKDAEIQQLKQRLDKLETLISNSTDKQNGGEK